MSNHRSSNPAFSDKVWERVSSDSRRMGMVETATIQGSINKTLILLACVVATSAVSWSYAPSLVGLLLPAVIVTSIIQLILAFMLIRNPVRAQNFGIAYALLEGITLGAISALFEYRYPGIVLQAVIGTAGVVCGMLIIYRAQIIKVTENFKIMVGAATFGVFFVYLISMIMNAFGSEVAFIHEGSTFGIIFSLLVIGIAAFNLAIDFDFIEKCEMQRAPKYMEWYGAFGLMITIVWIYIEILRLLAKTQKK